METKAGKLNVVFLGITEYQKALDIQQALHERVMNNEAGDTLLLLEHPPVLTMGQSAECKNVYLSEEQQKKLGVSVYRIDRGGDVTYHGPGQIVGYPIFNLTRHGKDVHAFMHKVQEVFLRLLAREFGLKPHREDGKYTGIWIGENKITAFGIHIRRWTTTHGFAFNVNTDLSHFRWINPCGLSDRGVTSLEEQMGEKQDMERLNKLIAQYFCEVFGMEENVCTLQSLIGS
ncbi:MAG: lipoyl(octanoyl) transferase LipB [Clostridiales bacterium]|nr:lipoyl(octanoyl) transferase LipB [Clostridiales bacterium]